MELKSQLFTLHGWAFVDFKSVSAQIGLKHAFSGFKTTFKAAVLGSPYPSASLLKQTQFTDFLCVLLHRLIWCPPRICIHQNFKTWPFWETGSLQMYSVKMRLDMLEWALSNWCPLRKSLNTKTKEEHTEKVSENKQEMLGCCYNGWNTWVRQKWKIKKTLF